MVLGPTTESVAIQIVFLFVAIIGAWVIAILLKGTAIIQNKGLQFGGAAAMFVTIFILLNRYVPEMRRGIISEAEAAAQSQTMNAKNGSQSQAIEVFLRPDRQVISSPDLTGLDLNKYIVDTKLGIAMIRSDKTGWVNSKLERYDVLSLGDIPFMGLALGTQSMIRSPVPKQKGIMAVTQINGHDIVVDKTSSIEGIKLDENPFKDPLFIRRIFKVQIESRAKMMGKEVSESDIDETITTMVDSAGDTGGLFDNFISKKLPVAKTINSGLYVSVFNTKDFHSDEKWVEEIQANMSPLDRATAFFIPTLGGKKNFKVDQMSQIASYDGSIRIRGGNIDGIDTDITINDLGFILADENKVIRVQLISLDTDGPETAFYLKAAMDSLFLTR